METEKPSPGDEGGDAFARRDDPDTSHEAAKHMRGRRAAILKAKICTALLRSPSGLASSQIADTIGSPRDSVTPRIPDLRRERRVVNSGKRIRLPGHSTSQTVWQLHPDEMKRMTDAT